MLPIRELPADVVAQIAAGEVITRAGDVVKELVENSIDAVLTRQEAPHASRLTHLGTISVEIVEGGHGRILVADDGTGIAAEDLPAAVRRHATSKIEVADDLHKLASLGFRGEALAAISAVADVAITSATSEGATGAAIGVRAGEIGSLRPQARRPGTTVTVEGLFERVPARRKYQRAASVETAHIGALLQAYALAYPEIAFSLTCDGRSVLRTTGSGELRDVALALFGPEAARELLAVRDERESEDETVALIAVSGLVGTPSLHRASRNAVFLAVNRRPIENRALAFALGEAYTTLLPVGRHPVAILDITVPPHEVDANVHPTKREVRLLRERLAFGVVQRAVRATLMQTIGMPRFGESSPSPVPMPEGPFDGAEVHLFDGSREADEVLDRPRLGSLRILGQVALTYIICEGRAGLYLVDQHAAHERVLLERLERDIGRTDRTQLLLEPAVVELPRVLRGALAEYVAALGELGFSVEPFGDGEVIVRGVPSALRVRDIDRVLRETHETLDAEGAGRDWREQLAVLLSCKTAVKAGQRLESMEMQSLLGQLDEANLCATCSHGRPTAILLSHSQLEREFGRR